MWQLLLSFDFAYKKKWNNLIKKKIKITDWKKIFFLFSNHVSGTFLKKS